MSQHTSAVMAATGPRTTPEPLYGGASTGRRVTVRDIAAAKARGEKWPMLTAYDALTAGIFDRAGIPVLLVGDSAAMVVYGHDTTIPVTVDDLIPLTAAVVRGTRRALVVADLPFGSYQASPGAALAAATRFLKETGAHAVKLEGGERVARQVEELVAAGIPVMAHLGLTPQSVNAFGGYRVQGRGEDGEHLLHDAKVLQAAGAFSVVLECVPAALAARVTELEISRERVVDAAETERRRIERDLHDGAQQRLVALAMDLGRAKARFADDLDAAAGLVDQAHAQAKEALTELRNLVRGVHPPVLTERGLDAALSGLAALCPVPVEVHVDVPVRPKSSVEAVAYFMVAEALTNVAKHSRASHAKVVVEGHGYPGTLTVMISDDGIGGADVHSPGLSGLADRVAGVDGRLSVESPSGGPTIIAAELPCG